MAASGQTRWPPARRSRGAALTLTLNTAARKPGPWQHGRRGGPRLPRHVMTLQVLAWPFVVCGRVVGMSAARIVLGMAGSRGWEAVVTRRAWLVSA